jgi:asparagine synthase (glutamine-hydrolysing)
VLSSGMSEQNEPATGPWEGTMCGIAGVYSPGTTLDAAIVGPMLASMQHRGPDDSGVQVLANGELVFGHLRLAILDLSPLGHQPMATSDENTWIVFNGEIYNFRELRSDLQSLGWTFRSDSDTEVVLAAYRAWGLKAVERFHGMFAFALWDAPQRVLHLCRDRFGVKPLYFSVSAGRLAFASEMKGLVRGGFSARLVAPTSIAEFVQYGYISAPRSIFADVQTVRPGTTCTFGVGLNATEHRYWSANALYDGEHAAALRMELERLTDEELLDRTEGTLQRAFSYRMIADVPVGIFLSGGIDSSLVAALLAKSSSTKLNTFTIAFPGSEFDESTYARAVAKTLGTEHVEFDVSPESALQTVSDIRDVADEPIGDSSLIPTLIVSRLARRYVKVALSADGADELFGGYARYAYCGRFVEHTGFVRGLYALSGGLLDLLPQQLIARSYAISRGREPGYAAINDKLRKFVRMSRANGEFSAYESAVSEWPAREAETLLANVPAGISDVHAAYDSVVGVDPRDRFMHFDMTRYLPGDLLVKVDRASMATSLEAREPFLDQDTAALAAALPMKWKIRGTENKYILRRLLRRHFDPALFERPKQGFSAPIGEWLRGPLRSLLREELSTTRVRELGILDSGAVDAQVNRFLSSDSRAGSAAGLWILLQLQLWAARWL